MKSEAVRAEFSLCSTERQSVLGAGGPASTGAGGCRPAWTHSPSSLPLSPCAAPQGLVYLVFLQSVGFRPPQETNSQGSVGLSGGGGRSIRVGGQGTRGPSLQVPRTVQVYSCPRGSLWTAPFCLEWVSLQAPSQAVVLSSVRRCSCAHPPRALLVGEVH